MYNALETEDVLLFHTLQCTFIEEIVEIEECVSWGQILNETLQVKNKA